jgi:hypothetical protein
MFYRALLEPKAPREKLYMCWSTFTKSAYTSSGGALLHLFAWKLTI